MSRYLILFLLCLPFIVLGITDEIVKYKLGKTTKSNMVFRILFWVTIGVGLALSNVIYEWLFTSKLTESEPLSLFDVVALVAIVVLLYAVKKLSAKLEEIRDYTRNLHEQLSIYTSTKK